MTSPTILSDLGTEILIPICAVKLVVEKPYADRKNRFTKALIEEEEGVNDYTVVGSPEKFTSAVYRQKSVTYRNLFGLMQWTVGSPEKFRRKSVHGDYSEDVGVKLDRPAEEAAPEATCAISNDLQEFKKSL
ncbi:putative inorganic diphosphatase [Helianthus anomalus]